MFQQLVVENVNSITYTQMLSDEDEKELGWKEKAETITENKGGKPVNETQDTTYRVPTTYISSFEVHPVYVDSIEPIVSGKYSAKKVIVDEQELLESLIDGGKSSAKYNNPEIFSRTSKKLLNNRETVMKVMQKTKDSSVLDYISDFWKDDEEIFYLMAKYCRDYVIKNASNRLKKDKEFVIKYYDIAGGAAWGLDYIDKSLLSDPDVIYSAVLPHACADTVLQYAGQKLLEDREFLLKVIKKNYVEFKNLPNFQDDKDFILKILNQDFIGKFNDSVGVIRYASERLKDDKDIGLVVVSGNGTYMEYLSKRLRNDKDIAITAVRNHPSAVRCFGEEIRKDYDVMLEAYNCAHTGSECEDAFGTIASELALSKPFVLECLNKGGASLVLKKLSKGSIYWKEENNEIKNLLDDEEIIQKAVRKGSESLKYASPRLQNDKPTVLIAVGTSGYALQYASEPLKDDKEVVLEAISQNPEVLKYASKRLQSEISLELETNSIDEIIRNYRLERQKDKNYQIEFLKSITLTQQSFDNEQKSCGKCIEILKEINEESKNGIHSHKSMNEFTKFPCYKYVWGDGEYSYYQSKIAAFEVKSLIDSLKEVQKYLYSSSSNLVIDSYIEMGFDIVKSTFDKFVVSRDTNTMIDNIIYEMLALNTLKQIYILYSKYYNDRDKSNMEILVSHLNQLAQEDYNCLQNNIKETEAFDSYGESSPTAPHI